MAEAVAGNNPIGWQGWIGHAAGLTRQQARHWINGWMRTSKMKIARESVVSVADNDDFRDMAFTFAIIALAAKLARIDGRLTHQEFVAFREAFPMPASEHGKIRRLYTMAAEDGADALRYARQVASLFPPASHRKLLVDLLARLAQLASVDGKIARTEEMLLRDVARIFGIGQRELNRLLSQTAQASQPKDPYLILGVKREWTDSEIKRAYHKLMREYHPDSVRGQGAEAEAVQVAERHVAILNAAYTTIRSQRQKRAA